MYCSKCGKLIQDNINFCPNCGNSLNNYSDQITQTLLLTINANLFRGVEAVGGKLLIYNNHLHFKSHSLNIQTGDTTINIQDISAISLTNTLGIVPNGLLIKTKQGTEFRFVVSQRNKTYQLITELIKKQVINF